MPYLSSFDYIELFGRPEAIRLTDTDQTGEPDDLKIAKALGDASNYADAFLAGRYTLPIIPAPEMLRQLTADLAREALHRTRPMPAVSEAADRARALLKDLSAGRATIPTLANGDQATPKPVTDLPASSGDGRPRVFTEERLDAYTDLGGRPHGAFAGPWWF